MLFRPSKMKCIKATVATALANCLPFWHTNEYEYANYEAQLDLQLDLND